MDAMTITHAGVGTWRKSRKSKTPSDCVEVAPLLGFSGVAVRDTKDRGGTELRFGAGFEAFLTGVKEGTFTA